MRNALRLTQVRKLNELGIEAVTLPTLLSILPKKVSDRRRIYSLTIGVCDNGKGWTAKYIDDFTDNDDYDSYQEAEELIDLIYGLIVWLRENKELVWL